jgi:hypothetical protein
VILYISQQKSNYFWNGMSENRFRISDDFTLYIGSTISYNFIAAIMFLQYNGMRRIEAGNAADFKVGGSFRLATKKGMK